MLRAENQTSGAALGDRIRHARRFGARLRGLLFRPPLREGEGLLLEPCRSIHTFGMRHPIDALFLDAAGEVVGRYERLAPWRATPLHRRARKVLELPAGTVARTGTKLGDRVQVQPSSG